MSVVRPAAAGAVAPSWPAFRSRNARKIIITPATIAYAPIVSAIAKAPMSGRISSSTPAMTERTPAAMMIHSPSIRLRSRNRGHDLRHAGDQRPRADQHGQREGRDGRPDERDDACADAGDAGHDIQRPVRPVLVAHRVDQQADPVDQRVRAEQMASASTVMPGQSSASAPKSSARNPRSISTGQATRSSPTTSVNWGADPYGTFGWLVVTAIPSLSIRMPPGPAASSGGRCTPWSGVYSRFDMQPHVAAHAADEVHPRAATPAAGATSRRGSARPAPAAAPRPVPRTRTAGSTARWPGPTSPGSTRRHR